MLKSDISIKRALDNLLFPGVLMHEAAHYIIVLLMSSATPEEVQLRRHDDSYVKYRVYAPRVYKSILISFAPFYVNTSISFLCAYKMSQMNSIHNWYDPIVFVLLYYICIVTAAKSLPSKEDVNSVFEEMKRHLFTNRFIILILLSPIYLAISIPIYIISIVKMKTLTLYYGLGLTYAIIVFIFSFLSGIGFFEWYLGESAIDFISGSL